MMIQFEDRSSDSPLIERVWRSQSCRGGPLTSIAAGHWEIIFTNLRSQVSANIRGPETRPTDAECPPEGEWLAVRFSAGTFVPTLPAATLLDGRDVTLPMLSKRRFLWQGDAWEIPRYESAESFVQRLESARLIARDPLVAAVARGEEQEFSARSRQRRFLAVTGLTHEAFFQIERARRAANLLRAGRGILETSCDLRYFDQPHLTRALKRWLGMTPGEIVRRERQLSFLYKTDRS